MIALATLAARIVLALFVAVLFGFQMFGSER